jgi:hypothetical protein
MPNLWDCGHILFLAFDIATHFMGSSRLAFGQPVFGYIYQWEVELHQYDPPTAALTWLMISPQI